MMVSSKKFFAVFLLVCVIIPCMLPANLSAATKINAISKTLYVGDTVKLKVTGTSKTIKWTSSKKSIATVNSNGLVTANSAGSATISAITGNSALKCKITVLSIFSAKEAVKNIAYDLKDTGNGVAAIIKNNNPVAVSIEAKLVYYNSSGKMIMAISDENYCLESGADCALFFIAPYNNDYEAVYYSDYKLTMSVEKSYHSISVASKININADMGTDNLTAEIVNASKYDLDTILISVVYYDSYNNIIGQDYGYAHCKTSGSVDYLTFSFPYNINRDIVQPSSFKIYVNCAYK